MNSCHQNLFLLLTAALLSLSLVSFTTNSTKKIFLDHSKKQSYQDSLGIDVLFARLSKATPIQRINITSRLEKFSLKEFSNYHKEKLEGYLISQQIPAKELILLSGFLRMESTLLALAKKHHNNKPLLQNINLALVRSGNFSKASTLRKNIEKLTINDPFVYEVLPSLAYTKERIIYDWLLDQIKLDKNNCHPADAEGAGKINCAFRIIEAIAPAINEFPIKISKWGDLDIGSYSKALGVVRKWISTHQRDYTLKKQTY